MKIRLTLACALAGYSSLSVAQTERDLDSHVHGAAHLNVAIVDSTVILELNTPWNNIVGFEHSPETEEQRAKLEKAMEQLNNPATILTFNGGDCVLEDVDMESGMIGDEHHDEHGDKHGDEHHDEHGDKHDDEHHDEHGDKHDDEHHDEHGDKHDEEHGDDHAHEHEGDHDGEEDTHSALLITYSYQCADISALDSIDLPLFSVWPGFEELEVQLVGSKGQTGVELDQQNTVLPVSSVM